MFIRLEENSPTIKILELDQLETIMSSSGLEQEKENDLEQVDGGSPISDASKTLENAPRMNANRGRGSERNKGDAGRKTTSQDKGNSEKQELPVKYRPLLIAITVGERAQCALLVMVSVDITSIDNLVRT